MVSISRLIKFQSNKTVIRILPNNLLHPTQYFSNEVILPNAVQCILRGKIWWQVYVAPAGGIYVKHWHTICDWLLEMAYVTVSTPREKKIGSSDTQIISKYMFNIHKWTIIILHCIFQSILALQMNFFLAYSHFVTTAIEHEHLESPFDQSIRIDDSLVLDPQKSFEQFSIQ